MFIINSSRVITRLPHPCSKKMAAMEGSHLYSFVCIYLYVQLLQLLVIYI